MLMSSFWEGTVGSDSEEWGKLQTFAQVIIFSLLVALIVVHLISRPATVTMGQEINEPLYVLILLALLVVVLPRVSSFSFEAFGVKARIATNAARSAVRKAGGETRDKKTLAATPEGQQVIVDPRKSLENSRETLIAELATLAQRKDVAFSGQLQSTANALQSAGAISENTSEL